MQDSVETVSRKAVADPGALGLRRQMLYRAGVLTPVPTFKFSESADRLSSEKRLLTVARRMPERPSGDGGHAL